VAVAVICFNSSWYMGISLLGWWGEGLFLCFWGWWGRWFYWDIVRMVRRGSIVMRREQLRIWGLRMQ
jgi:hypothetical protein